MTYKGQKQQGEYQQQTIALQRNNEAERRRAMELDAMRRRREMIRQAIAARSQALQIATHQGISQDGSALPGAYGGIQGRTGVNLLGVSQNEEIGGRIFDNNAQISQINSRSAAAGTYANMGAGLSSLGGGLVKAQGTIDRVGTYFSSFFQSGNNPVNVGSATSWSRA